MAAEFVTLSDEETAKCMAALAEAAFMPLPSYSRGRFALLSPGPPERGPAPLPPRELSDEDRQQIADAFAAMDKRIAFWKEHYRELVCQYPEQFLAVKDGKPIASDPYLVGLWEKLDGLRDEGDEIYVEFMTLKPRILLP